jgi:hypothetical protein
MWVKTGMVVVIFIMFSFPMVFMLRFLMVFTFFLLMRRFPVVFTFFLIMVGIPVVFILFMIMVGFRLLAFMVFLCVVIMMVVSLHGKLFDIMVRMDYLEMGTGCSYFA